MASVDVEDCFGRAGVSPAFPERDSNPWLLRSKTKYFRMLSKILQAIN